MGRPPVAVALFALIAGPLAVAPAVAQFQFPNLFEPPRPPSDVPNRPPGPPERVPPPAAAPQTRSAPLAPPPGSFQSQPLPPPPGAPAAPPQGDVGRTLLPPGQPPGQRPVQRGTPQPATTAPQPGDEVVTEPPAQKITNPTAVFAGLDKITGRIISFDVAINETVQFGALQVTPRVCYTRPPTETPNTDAFAEVDEVTLQGEIRRIFTGWMFASSPGLHGVEHAIYDVWLTDCKGGVVAAAVEPAAPTPAPPPPAARAPAKAAPKAAAPKTAQPARPTAPPPGQGSFFGPPPGSFQQPR
jgi:hypothetical protein